jgi:hypothetical protein
MNYSIPSSAVVSTLKTRLLSVSLSDAANYAASGEKFLWVEDRYLSDVFESIDEVGFRPWFNLFEAKLERLSRDI